MTRNDSAVSIVQRGNLKALEGALRKQWRLGQNIVLCWSADSRGVLVIMVPHYFLGNYCARREGGEGADNEAFVRQLVSGERRKTREELFAVAERLDVAPGFIKLDAPLSEEPAVLAGVEQLIKRYGISFVADRSVLLFDIAEFSLFTPFEQASQLNSLSYSLNSAYNKLQASGIVVNFARTTTGDGYYVWNRDLGPAANRDLFCFMLLVIADNAVARAASSGHTVPVIRSAFHNGSHYELYQAEGVNPTVLSYIVGDVTIELARMVDLARPSQIFVGNFQTRLPGPLGELVYSPAFVREVDASLKRLRGVQLAGQVIESMHCRLTGSADPGDRRAAQRFLITDKHGLSRHAYNLELSITLQGGRTLRLGLDREFLTGAVTTGKHAMCDTGPDSEGSPRDSMRGDQVLVMLSDRRRARISRAEE